MQTQTVSIPILGEYQLAKSIDQRNRLKLVSYHEAGHVFAAWHLGFKLKGTAAEINPDGPSFGLTHFVGENLRCPDGLLPRVQIENAAIVLLAGASALRKHCGCFESGYMLSSSDYDQARTLVKHLVLDVKDADMPWLGEPYEWGSQGALADMLRVIERRADCLVSQNWQSIKRIARRLSNRRMVCAREIAGLAGL